MYTMKEVGQKTGLSYDTIKYYCNEGLIPNVKRDKNNYRIFDDNNVAWINSLSCLKNCGMSIIEMKEYLKLCLEGQSTIPKRKEILDITKKKLYTELDKIQKNIDYINRKQQFYDDVLSGKIEYYSNLIDVKKTGK